MPHLRHSLLLRLLKLATCALVLRVLFAIALNFRDYFPPRFDQGFLIGREAYFFGPYSWAFYTHIVAGPISLFLGTVLISESFRMRFLKWHRVLGRVQVACVLLLVAPSGLGMAFRAETGAIAGAGFATLAVLTSLFVVLGWRNAVQRRFDQHRRWMLRCYVTLFSAVVIRVIGGAVVLSRTKADWIYPFSAWISWLLPLLILELCWNFKAKTKPSSPVSISTIPASADISATPP